MNKLYPLVENNKNKIHLFNHYFNRKNRLNCMKLKMRNIILNNRNKP
jgi:hypothetical protein